MTCAHDAPRLNLRPWPGEEFHVFECSACGSTVSISNDQLEAERNRNRERDANPDRWLECDRLLRDSLKRSQDARGDITDTLRLVATLIPHESTMSVAGADSPHAEPILLQR